MRAFDLDAFDLGMLCNTRAGGNSQRYVLLRSPCCGRAPASRLLAEVERVPERRVLDLKAVSFVYGPGSPLSRSAAMPVRSRLSRRYEVLGRAKGESFRRRRHGRLLMQGHYLAVLNVFGRFRLLQEAAIAHSSASPPSARLFVLSHDLGATLGISNDTHPRRTALPGSKILALPTYRNDVGMYLADCLPSNRFDFA